MMCTAQQSLGRKPKQTFHVCLDVCIKRIIKKLTAAKHVFIKQIQRYTIQWQWYSGMQLYKSNRNVQPFNM